MHGRMVDGQIDRQIARLLEMDGWIDQVREVDGWIEMVKYIELDR